MEVPTGASQFDARQKRLRARLEANKLSALLVTKPANLFYLTNFRGSAGVLIFALRTPVLWVDPRYTLQAREAACGVEVREEKGRLLTKVGQWLAERSKGRAGYRVGYEDSHLTCAALTELRRDGLRLRPASGMIEEMRSVKDAAEIDCIRRAGHLTAVVFEEVRQLIRPGIRECEVAAEIEYRMRRGGAEGPAFETIVASGPRAALPHARASAKPLEHNEFVILDLGAILAGYTADMTRTVYLGEPSHRFRNLYRAVRESQESAVEMLRPGVEAQQVDAAARRTLARARLGKYFTHSTGHGVGLEIHEAPRLARGQETLLQSGSVVTAEPGVYLEGLGGVRIEDTVLVCAGAPEILTPASKDDWLIA
ncbi:MAG TPA: Xaa-Pro peptidase family protein [Terriglobia bacterium]|nr:Xaa-Pro peptidase family protein [Terriglobia bacterium]